MTANCSRTPTHHRVFQPLVQTAGRWSSAVAPSGRPTGIAAIRVRILLPVPLTTVLEEGLQAVVGRCGVHNTLHVPPEVTVELG